MKNHFTRLLLYFPKNKSGKYKFVAKAVIEIKRQKMLMDALGHSLGPRCLLIQLSILNASEGAK